MSVPSAHEWMLALAQERAGSNEITDVINRTLSELTGLAVLSIAGLGTLLVTAKDQPSLYRRTAALFGVVALAALATGIKHVIPTPAPKKT